MANKGFPLTELTLETVLRDGLAELRSNPARIDYLFNRFLEAQFQNQYGQAKIDEVKTYLTENKIKIVHGQSMQPVMMPCISIQMVQSDERSEDQHLGNFFPEELYDKTPDVIIAVVSATSYNTVTGQLNISDVVDLSAICPGLIFHDADGTEFPIYSGISNILGKKFINIGTGKEPNLSSPGQIVDLIDFDGMTRGMIRLREVIRLGVHAHDDIHLPKYLYYIVYYILKSRQKSLITRGVHLDQGMVGVFDRQDDYAGENVYARFFDMHCLTEFNYTIDEVAAASCFEINVKT